MPHLCTPCMWRSLETASSSNSNHSSDSCWLLEMQAGWLLPIPGWIYNWRRSQYRFRAESGGIQGSEWCSNSWAATDASDTSRSCSQLLGLLLRDPQCTRPSLSAGEECIRRSDCRAGCTEWGELPRLHSHHAVATGQPHSVDLWHADRWLAYLSVHISETLLTLMLCVPVCYMDNM